MEKSVSVIETWEEWYSPKLKTSRNSYYKWVEVNKGRYRPTYPSPYQERDETTKKIWKHRGIPNSTNSSQF